MDTEGIYGYSDVEVSHLIDQISSYTANVLDYLTVDMQKNFINPMAENWVCKEAQDFFASFKEIDERLAIRIRDRRDELIKFISEAANSWSQQTNSGRTFVVYDSSGFVPNLDISGIKENYNNIRGINMKHVPEIMRTLMTIIDNTKEDMNSIKRLTVNVPFLGGSQHEKLIQLVDVMTNMIVEEITGFVNATKVAIDNTLTKYGDTAAMVSEKLS